MYCIQKCTIEYSEHRIFNDILWMHGSMECSLASIEYFYGIQKFYRMDSKIT